MGQVRWRGIRPARHRLPNLKVQRENFTSKHPIFALTEQVRYGASKTLLELKETMQRAAHSQIQSPANIICLQPRTEHRKKVILFKLHPLLACNKQLEVRTHDLALNTHHHPPPLAVSPLESLHWRV